jgi:hypothetical protein
MDPCRVLFYEYNYYGSYYIPMLTLSNFFSPEGDRHAIVTYNRNGFEVLCTHTLEKTLEKKIFDREVEADEFAENWVLNK